jgi:GxxExxY protein
MNGEFNDIVDRRLTEAIVQSAVEVHRELGPGLLESTYRSCLVEELRSRDIEALKEVSIPFVYKGHMIDATYRADIIVQDAVLLELKTVEHVLPIHEAQLLTYLKLSKLRVGFLINFNVTRLSKGLRRFVR